MFLNGFLYYYRPFMTLLQSGIMNHIHIKSLEALPKNSSPKIVNEIPSIKQWGTLRAFGPRLSVLPASSANALVGVRAWVESQDLRINQGGKAGDSQGLEFEPQKTYQKQTKKARNLIR